jgi:hypothetical protein
MLFHCSESSDNYFGSTYNVIFRFCFSIHKLNCNLRLCRMLLDNIIHIKKMFCKFSVINVLLYLRDINFFLLLNIVP